MFSHSLPELLVLSLTPGQLENISHREEQLLGRQGLFQKVHRSKPGGADRHFNVGLSRNHHHRDRDPERLQLFQQGEPVPSRHHDIGKNHVEAPGPDQFDRADHAVADSRFVPGEPEGPRQRSKSVRIVIHDQ